MVAPAEQEMPRAQLPTTGNPNSSVIERDREGKIIRRRFFSPDGKAIKNIDFEAHHGASSPHAHDWDWTQDPPRQSPRPLKPGE
jgi:hypothetical protein